MKKKTLDQLLDPGDVFQITDQTDEDYKHLFVYRGIKSGHYVLDEIGKPNLVVVESLPTYRKAFHIPANYLDVLVPTNEVLYAAMLQDIHEQSQRITETLKSNSTITYTNPIYEVETTTEPTRVQQIGSTRRITITHSGTSVKN
ncbi:MAG: hypothetical protein WC254_04540 [Candidatus Woesearchaeota archaeon]|jgi:hypothetical protein